jgi:signal transduction histidine kinase
MSFSTRLALSIAVLVALSAVLGVAALAAIGDLHARLAASDEMYEELRGVYEIGQRAATAQALLEAPLRNEAEIRRQLLACVRGADELIPSASAESLAGPLRSIRAGIEEALVAGGDRRTPAQVAQRLKVALAEVAGLAAAANRAIVEGRRLTTDRVERSRWTLGLLLVVTTLAAGLLGAAQHRSVSRPLRVLRRGVEEIASRGAAGCAPLPERGPRDFRALIRQFNRMAATIQALEASLGRQVEVKDEQLRRSERLAGVGYLAAGIAHEINNPLGVIGGYAETMLRRLDGAAIPGDVTRELDEALRTITDEVFRCHEITSGLLQMTRPGDEGGETFDLRALVGRTVSMLRRHPLCRDRELVLDDGGAAPLLARGSRTQLMQVFLNLLTNGLEAVQAGCGVVTVAVAAQAGSALVRVSDNGCGMTAAELDQVFDPLYTGKSSGGRRGFGLGLSVSHAIIERHGGRIDARSEGPGRGSSFLVELPAISVVTSVRP